MSQEGDVSICWYLHNGIISRLQKLAGLHRRTGLQSDNDTGWMQAQYVHGN